MRPRSPPPTNAPTSPLRFSDTAVGHHRRAFISGHCVVDSFFQNRYVIDDLEPLDDGPSENPMAEVVDDTTEPGLSPIDQAHRRAIYVPCLVRRVDAHIHRFMRELSRRGPRARCTIVQVASLLRLNPRCVTRRRDTEDLENRARRKNFPRPTGRTQQPGLHRPAADVESVNPSARHTQYRDQETREGGQGSDTTARLHDLGPQVGLRHVKHGHGDHRLQFLTEPAGRDRSGNARGGGEADVARLADRITEPVVVDLLTDCSLCHGEHLHRRQLGRNPVVLAPCSASTLDRHRSPEVTRNRRKTPLPVGKLLCDKARRDIFEYLEVHYNTQRPHSLIGNIGPLAFERLAQQERLAS